MERAIILLAFQGTDILGTIEDGDVYWQPDKPCRCRSNINRIFRSIGRVSLKQHSPDCMSFVEADVMDVLATTQPQIATMLPSPSQLNSAAQRLLEGVNPCYQVLANDLAVFIELFIRMRLHKTSRGRGLYYGTLEESSLQKEELVKNLVQRFPVDEEHCLTPESMFRGLDILVRLALFPYFTAVIEN